MRSIFNLVRRSRAPATDPRIAELEERVTTIENPGVPLSGSNLSQYFGWINPDVSKIHVTLDRSLAVPAVWAAVDFIASTVASLPFHLYTKDEEVRKKAVDLPLYDLLHSAPNADWSSSDAREFSGWQLMTHGRWLWYIERGANNTVTGLFPMSCTRTQIKTVNGRRAYRYDEDQGHQEYDSTEVIDVPFALRDDMVSHRSPIFSNRPSMQLNIALQDYATKLFANGGIPPMQLVGNFNSPQAVSRASDDVTKAIQQAAREGKQVLPLPMHHELKGLGFNAEETQMMDARTYALQECARIWRMPPPFLQDLSKGTYNNVEQAALTVAKHTIEPWLTKIEQQMALKLFRDPARRRTRVVEFNLDGLLRGDFKTRTEGLAKLIQNSLLTPNEGRALDNRPPVTGGDNAFIQQNMAGLSALGEDDEGASDGEA